MSRISGIFNEMNKRTFLKKRKIKKRCKGFLIVDMNKKNGEYPGNQRMRNLTIINALLSNYPWVFTKKLPWKVDNGWTNLPYSNQMKNDFQLNFSFLAISLKIIIFKENYSFETFNITFRYIWVFFRVKRGRVWKKNNLYFGIYFTRENAGTLFLIIFLDVLVEHRVVMECFHLQIFLEDSIEEDWYGSEEDVVTCQKYSRVQRLKLKRKK